MKKIVYGVFLCILFVVDRATKWYALMHWEQGVNLVSFVRLELSLNRGISWGLLCDSTPYSWLFITTTILIIALTTALLVYAYTRYSQGHTPYAEGLILVGSISNIIDRLLYGGVIDFIVLHWREFIWPTFNLADASIVLGIGILFVKQLLSPDR